MVEGRAALTWLLDTYLVRVQTPMTDLGEFLRVCKEHNWDVELVQPNQHTKGEKSFVRQHDQNVL